MVKTLIFKFAIVSFFIACLIGTSTLVSCCHKIRDDSPAAPKGFSMCESKSPLRLSYSDIAKNFIEFDSDGHPVFNDPPGKKIKISAVVSDIKLKKKSPSISIENDIVWFSLPSSEIIPGLGKFDTIELKFDQYGLYHEIFSQGERWDLIFSENGELVSVIKQR